MELMIRNFLCLCLTLLFGVPYTVGQQSICDPDQKPALSQRLANYDMKVVLDDEAKQLQGTQLIQWVNHSPDTVRHLEMYMYLNAFKNSESSYIKGSGLNIMGQDLSGRTADMWGFINLHSIHQDGISSHLNQRYVQDLDDNTQDQSVVRIDLEKAVLPGDTLTLSTTFTSKLPKTMSRVGYAANNFFHFVHWYPKLGVYEQNLQGDWGWNCHQFLRQMEFYGEFGVYNMEITCSDQLKVGASGCRVDQRALPSGLTLHKFEAQDVIDFAWCAYPDFKIYEDNWNGVEIELFSPGHHRDLVPRLIGAVKNSLQYMHDHVGPYPYPKITVMDPPALGMRSGFMEYPTYITGGSFFAFPKGVKSLESLIAHEFAHQYFMGMLANNEKEAPWLDEGFVTFFEDCIMEAYYDESCSLIDFGGYKLKNSALSRNEYVSLPDKRISKITEKSWEIRGAYKGIVYAKTATLLRTIKNIVGDELFFDAIRTYFSQYRFTHPRKDDFINSFSQTLSKQLTPEEMRSISKLMSQGLDDTVVCDMAVLSINNFRSHQPTGLFDGDDTLDYKPLHEGDHFRSSTEIGQLGDMIVPVDILIRFSDGTTETRYWNGVGETIRYQFSKKVPIVEVQIDPFQKIYLDIDLNNNSKTLEPNKIGILKYASRAIFWVQNIFQSVSFLM